MKNIIPITLLSILTCSVAHAQPSSQVAWTPDKLNFVKKANAENGKKLTANCAGCHGEQGISVVADTPSLAGQLATYTYKQLQDYKNSDRIHAVMNGMASGLSEQDMADIAVWYSSLPATKNKPDNQSIAAAEKLVSRGDGKRTLPPCFTCHGSKGQGEKQDIPALAGQRADYLASTLQAYKDDTRKNDIYSRMRILSKQLTADEIQAVAKYYQQLN